MGVMVSSALAYEHSKSDFSSVRKVTDSEKAMFLEANKRAYEVFHAYGQSKVCSMLCMKVLCRKLADFGSDIPVNALHPGEIDTNITGSLSPALAFLTKAFKPVVRMIMKSPHQGSIGSVFACSSPDVASSKQMTGRFLMRLAPIVDNDAWLDVKDSEKCWNISKSLTDSPDVLASP